MVKNYQKYQPQQGFVLHTNKDNPKLFYSIKQLETQLFRYPQKEMTIKLIGDYLLSLKPWTKNDKEPQNWKWSGYLEQPDYKGIILKIPKQLFLDDILQPEEFLQKPIQNPLIHRVLNSIQSGRTYKNQNLFYLIEPNLNN